MNSENSAKLIGVLVIATLLTRECYAEKPTIERIRKHQEWLQQRRLQKQKSQLSQSPFKTSFELPNLWRYPKVDNKSRITENPSLNEVYPENEKLITANKLNVSHEALTTTEGHGIEATTTASSASTKGVVLSNFTENTVDSVITSTTSTESTTISSTNTSANFLESSKLLMTTTAPISKKHKSKLHPYPRWGNWSQWSECSRSCGVGVMYQQRKCINRNATTEKRYISNSCVGVYKRFHTCNEEPCPAAENQDFRALQCSAFNNNDFQGQKYDWEPYIKDDAECELNCKPIGMKYFATLNASVVDGTPCMRPAEFYRSGFSDRAVCVNGVCKASDSFLT